MYKVLQISILAFLAAAVVIGASISYFLRSRLGENGALSLFAAAVFLLALLYPRVRGPLPREAADFWYYLLMTIGVIGFFIQNETQRLELDFSARIRHLNSEISEIEGRLSAFDRVISDSPNHVLESLRGEAQAALAHWQGDLDYVCGCAIRRCNPVPRIYANPFADTRTDWGNHWQQLCEKLKQDRAAGILVRLAGAATLNDLLTIDVAKLQESKLQIRLYGTLLPLREVVLTLRTYLSDPAARHDPRGNLRSQLSQKGLTRKVLEDAYQKRILESRGNASVLMVYLWSYILLSMLGLKLCRFKYAL
jgi:hypothetical protein